jgi:cobalt-zinc-cadmium efflux system protein
MWLTGAFMLAEVAGGVWSGSLALLADAGHMLTDTAALAFAWLAFQVSRRPPDLRRSYGYHRFQVLAAFVNGAALLGMVVWILWEALQRLRQPPAIAGGLMLVIAVLGLVVNLVAFYLLHGGDRSNLNLRGAALHVLGDLLGSVATILAAVVILATGWTPIDPWLSIFVALLILRGAWLLLKQSGHILLEGTPVELDLARLRAVLHSAVPALQDVHHVHAWSLTPGHTMLTLHAQVSETADQQQALREIHRALRDGFGIAHATVQVEHAHCLDELATHAGHPNCGSEPADLSRT